MKHDSSQDLPEPTMETIIKNMFAQMEQSLNRRLDGEREERVRQEVDARRRSLESQQQLEQFRSEILERVSDVQQENIGLLGELRTLNLMDTHERQEFPIPPARRSSLEPRAPAVTLGPQARRSSLETKNASVVLEQSTDDGESEQGRLSRQPGASIVHIMHVAEHVDSSLLIRQGTVTGKLQCEENRRNWEVEKKQSMRLVYFVHPALLRQLIIYDQSAGKSASTGLLTMANVHNISDSALNALWSARIRGQKMKTPEGFEEVFWTMIKRLEPTNPKWKMELGEDYDLYMQGSLGRWITDLHDAWYFLTNTASAEEMKHWPPQGWCDLDDDKVIGQVQMAMMALDEWQSPFVAFITKAELKKVKDIGMLKDKLLAINVELGKNAQELRSRRALFSEPRDRRQMMQGRAAALAARQEASDNRSHPFSRHGLVGGQDSGPKPRTPMVGNSRSEQLDHDRFSLAPEETTPQRLDPGARLTAPKPLPLLQEGSSRDADSAKHGAMQSLSPYDEDEHHGSGTRDSRKSSQPCIYHFTGRCNRNCGRTHDADAMLQHRDDLVDQIWPPFEQLMNSPWVKPQWVIDQFTTYMRKSPNEEVRRIAAFQRLNSPLYPEYHS